MGPGHAENETVGYAKSLDVTTLDPTLSSQRLDKWLRVGPAHLKEVRWRQSDCDLKPDTSNPNYDAPLCVNVMFKRDTAGGNLLISVGTTRKGISGPPQLIRILVGKVGELGGAYSERLSDLPRLLDESSSTGGAGISH